MTKQVKTSNFIVRFEDLGNDIYSMAFSVNGSSFNNTLPKCIFEKPNDPLGNYDFFRREHGWSSYREEQDDPFILFDLIIEGDVNRFNIITWNDRIIHVRILHTYYSSETLKIEKYSDSVVIITDYSETKVFVNSSGLILLRTDGIPNWSYKYIGYLEKKDYMPFDLVTSPHFVLARINNQWAFFDAELTRIKVCAFLLNLKVDGTHSGDYVILHLFPANKQPYNPISEAKSVILYKDGSVIFSRDKCFFEHVNKYEEVSDYYYASGRCDLPVFRKGKYLFTIKSKSCYSLFDNEDKLAVFYNEMETDIRFGIMNRKLETVVPPILEYAYIKGGSIIMYKLNGKTGMWDESLSSLAPPKYQSIVPIESFFLASIKGGFPNAFWADWGHTFDGDVASYSDIREATEECVIIKRNGELSWPEPFDNVYCEFLHCRFSDGVNYDASLSLVIVEKDCQIKYGIISSFGDFIIPPTHNFLEIILDRENKKNHNPKAFKYGVNTRIEETVSPRGNKKYVVKGGRYGLLSLEGKIIIPALYDAITVYGDFIRVRNNDMFGLYSIDGEVLLDTICTAINFIEVGGKTAFAVYNVNGVVKGDLSTFDEYYSFGLKGFNSYGPNNRYYSSKAVTVEGGTWGFYNLFKRIRGEAIYTEVHPFSKGRAIVKKDGSYYLIDYNLKICSEARESIRYGKYCSKNYSEEEWYYVEPDYGCSDDDREQMYRDAFEGDPESEWNID